MINNNLGKFFGPSSSYSGYILIAAGLIALTYSWISLTLIVPGMFMAFTYTGTLIDINNKRIKPYTALFGVYRAGQWISTNQFTRFSIIKSTKKYTSYSRGSVRFDMSKSDIELLLTDNTKSKKVVLKMFRNFEDARKYMDELSILLSVAVNYPESTDKILPDF